MFVCCWFSALLVCAHHPMPAEPAAAWLTGAVYCRQDPPPLCDIAGARALLVLGDAVTTDHISPAGSIARTSPAARYLAELG